MYAKPMQTLTPHLTDSLADAWSDRAAKSLDTLDHALRAPGLFKPAYVEQVIADGRKAMSETRRWQGQHQDDET